MLATRGKFPAGSFFMKRRIFIALSMLVGLAIFITVLIQNFEVFQTLGQLNYIYFIPYLFFSFLIVLIHVLRWKLILFSHNKRINFFQLLLYKISGFSVSYFTPSAQIGGEPVRARFLKKHDMKFHQGLSAVMIDKFIEIAISVLLGIVGFFFLILKFTVSDNTTLLILFALIFAVIGVLVFYKRMIDKKPFISYFFRFSKHKKIFKIRRTMEKSEKMVSLFFTRKKKMLLASFLLTMINFFIMFLEFHFLFMVFGITSDIGKIFMVVTVVGISYIMPIPAALGVMEVSEAGLFSILGLEPSTGVGLSLIVRFKDSIIALLGLGYLANKGIKALGLSKK